MFSALFNASRRVECSVCVSTAGIGVRSLISSPRSDRGSGAHRFDELRVGEGLKASHAGGVPTQEDAGVRSFSTLSRSTFAERDERPDPALLGAMDAIPGGDFEFEPPTLVGNDLKPMD